MLLHVLIFQSNDDSVINLGRITYIQALYTHVHVLIRRITMSMSSACLFFYDQKRN